VRAVVQRVQEARVRVEGGIAGEMGEGLLALVGVGRGDGLEEARSLARRLVRLRVFEDSEGRMNRDLLEIAGTLGVVSQFTLYGDTRKGRRPSFVEAAPPDEAAPLVEALVEAARLEGAPVITGRFRTHMRVELVNDGPVTLILDTDRAG
jgi:D-tyrosyl-tRNA(Tyr) deacylase